MTIPPHTLVAPSLGERRLCIQNRGEGNGKSPHYLSQEVIKGKEKHLERHDRLRHDET